MDNTAEIDELLVSRLSKAGLAAKPGQTGDHRHVRMWLRAGCRCEYCGEELLTDLVRMMSTQRDHLLPWSKYPEFREIDDNWVLACYCCNQIKRNYDPLQELDERARVRVTPENMGAYRDALVTACIDYLSPKLKERNVILSNISVIIDEYNG